MLAGKPLVAHAIEAALSSKWIDHVVVSTDDAEIASVARQYGAQVPFMRPHDLALDGTPEWLVWRHAIETLKAMEGRDIEVFTCIPPTAPLRAVEDVDACIETLLAGDSDIVITVKPSERNPYFNMVALDERGYAHMVIQPRQPIHRRQEAPIVYDVTTVAYAAKPEFVVTARSLFEGRVRTVVVPRERAIDIDTELDLQFADFLLSRGTARPGT